MTQSQIAATIAELLGRGLPQVLAARGGAAAGGRRAGAAPLVEIGLSEDPADDD